MKHWDGRDRDHGFPLRVPRLDVARLAQALRSPARRQHSPHIGSLIGLALAVGLVAGLAWVLAPADPVSAGLLD
jgi:hypothetical protein